MKCPCCGEQRNTDLLVHGRHLYFADGTNIKVGNLEASLLEALIAHPLQIPQKLMTTMHVGISRLRKVLLEIGSPYYIVTDRTTHCYILRRTKADVQNHNDAKRSKNVYS